MSEVALVVIDVQVGMFEGPEGPFENAEKVLENVVRLVEKARSAGVDVVFVQHCEGPGGVFVPGTHLFDIHPAIVPAETEPVVWKQAPDAFHETDLKRVLDARGVERPILCGLQTEFCVDTACRRAFSLGYDVTLASDAHGTRNKEGLPAEKIISHHNETLGGWFAGLEDTESMDFRTKKGRP